MQNHSYAEETYDYDEERENRSRGESSREREHNRNEGDRERDILRTKSRDDNVSLYNQAEFLDYKEMHYRENENRKIRDKYNAILEALHSNRICALREAEQVSLKQFAVRLTTESLTSYHFYYYLSLLNCLWI